MTLSTDTGSRSVSASLLRPDRRPPAVLTDFDDTAAVQNVAELLLHRFGHPTWTDVRERFRRGELSLKDYQEIAFREMRGDKAAMQSYVRENACFRGHFDELAQFCQDHSIPMCIVSQGLDFYIQALLDDSAHPRLPVHAARAEFDANDEHIVGYAYDFAYPDAPELGNSKALMVRSFQDTGHHVFFAGDGRSDFEAGEVADTVFAHRQMAEMCSEAGISYIPFTDFGPVLDALRRYAGHLQ